MNSIQHPSTVTNPAMASYCIILPLTLPYPTKWQITNSLLEVVFQKEAAVQWSTSRLPLTPKQLSSYSQLAVATNISGKAPSMVKSWESCCVHQTSATFHNMHFNYAHENCYTDNKFCYRLQDNSMPQNNMLRFRVESRQQWIQVWAIYLTYSHERVSNKLI